MRKGYHLGNCTTCQAILQKLDLPDGFELKEIKGDRITAKELDKMKSMSGSYESLFSRRAMKYRSMGLNNKSLTEKDYRRLILDEYTFLKRPVFIIDDEIFIGNTKKVIEAAYNKLHPENG